MAAQVEGETTDGLKPYLEALSPVLQADAPEFGWLNIPVLKDYLGWLKQMGVLDLREDPARCCHQRISAAACRRGAAGNP